MIKILVFGTFDGLHEGHLNFFKQAREYGDYLIVVVGRDSTVERVKKRLPKQNENERLLAVQKCGLVDYARLGNATAVGHRLRRDPAESGDGVPSEGGKGVSVYKVIEEIKPDVICLGYDQMKFTDKLEEEIKKMDLSIEIKRLKAYKPEIYHSSLLDPPN